MLPQRNTIALASLIVGIVAVSYVFSRAAEDGPVPAAANEPNFKGKFLLVSQEGDGGAALTDAELRKAGGRVFLVGTGVDCGEDWKDFAGKTMWLSIDKVLQITEFDNFDDLKRIYDEP
jgi:hypothetical protein